ncbi:CUN109 putative bro protein, ATP_GTP_A motif, similar to AcMNPV ORF2 [Culex nigripalpus nucleopolyhedrovirus]|uniref:CUN109 putative bro protein, ATP_GTP_A motif, similar to AcMNPV ORF2 n=1 Tax=Culex nigripalpus nucleopolyhedrovirus (isolate Florida/1997) TaxID=645993 RepID=Q919G8_NPVCO|nr:CUN109 putative bro protein, ATP_GTP_A motif, similar to AcMNPV ORF2 [Culex nigripalpus nucleopolyhedrovirus]AAK94187.1 CUN109 putative bro protein, ATP_GTP_A motif, similar to AcMNPV ORF2 [Culex nigripalpus nucleopolyhedrovirus]
MSAVLEHRKFASLDGKVVLPFYRYRDPTTGAVWISGKSVATGLGYTGTSGVLLRKVGSENRIKWRELCKDEFSVQLPNGWHPDTVMINQRGFQQLLGPKRVELNALWCNEFGDEVLPIEVETDTIFQTKMWDFDGVKVGVRVFIDPSTGEPWTVAKDLAYVMGYKNGSEAHGRIFDSFKQTVHQLLGKDHPKVRSHEGRLVLIDRAGANQLILQARIKSCVELQKSLFCAIGNRDPSELERRVPKLNMALQRATTEKVELENKLKQFESEFRAKQAELQAEIKRRDDMIEDIWSDIDEFCDASPPQIAPELPEPKEDYIALYERTVEDGCRVVRVCRAQSETLDKYDNMMRKIKKYDLEKEDLDEQHHWLLNCTAGPRIRCASAKDTWTRCKLDNREFMFTLETYGGAHNDFRALSEPELRAKYTRQKKYHNPKMAMDELDHEDLQRIVDYCMVGGHNLMERLGERIRECLEETNDAVRERLKRRKLNDY